MNQAIIYIRVSTAQQADEGVSLAAQEKKARAWADLNDYEVKAVFTDAGLSGKRADNRKGLQDALNVCGKGDALVVYSLSRLARSTVDTIAISERLQDVGTDLVSVSEKIDTTSAAGKMIFRMLAVMAEFESDQISERVRLGMDFKRSQGKRVGSIPFGSKLDDNGVDLLPDKVELEVIEMIKSLKRDGLGLNKIARHLNENQYKPRGKQWYPQTIKRILAA
mgnify:CR=1 FL=1